MTKSPAYPILVLRATQRSSSLFSLRTPHWQRQPSLPINNRATNTPSTPPPVEATCYGPLPSRKKKGIGTFLIEVFIHSH
jgi:hypothetical protein